MASERVFVVDGDAAALRVWLGVAGEQQLEAVGFRSAEEFLQAYRGEPGCVVAEYRLPGMHGLELQQELLRRGWSIPFVLASTSPRTQVTVQAMQQGAATVLDKRSDRHRMAAEIRAALHRDREQREALEARRIRGQRLASLTPKEREVLRLILAGRPNKAIAGELDVSIRTVENRRRSIFAKLRASCLAELVTLAANAPVGD